MDKESVPFIPLPCNPREDSCLELADNEIAENALSEELECEIARVPGVSM